METVDFIRLSKRLTAVTRELEIEALDIAFNSKALLSKKFPRKLIDVTTKRLESYTTELQRVTNAWTELTKEKDDTNT